MKRAILFALLLACGTVQASEWVSIGKPDSGTYETFVDVSTIRIMGSVRRAWEKVVFTPHTMTGVGVDAKKWVSYAVFRAAFNCSEETATYEGLIFYYDDGTNYFPPADTAPPSLVPPETVLSSEMQFICAWGKK
jgi:hypothetical protein